MSWPFLDWYVANKGKPVWMVCRNGHLWQGTVPWSWDLEGVPSIFERARLGEDTGRDRIRSVTRCTLCKLLKAGNPHLRGITKCHPDWRGVIREARMLANGTIEHHQPKQIDEAYREEDVTAWRVLLAFVSISVRRAER